MQSEDYLNPLDMKRLHQRRWWYILAFALFVSSLLAVQPLLLLAALFSLFIVLAPGWWYGHALRFLHVRQHIHSRHLFFGEEVILSVTIENQKALPLFWLTCQEPVRPALPILSQPDAQHETIGTLDNSGGIWGFERVTRHYRWRCYERGFYTIGPLTLESSDLFGWLKRQVTLPLYDTLLVYPLISPLEDLCLSRFHLFGEARTSQGLFEEPLYIIGVRDYQMGDDPRRIHWKATARSGELRSKVYEYSHQRRVLVLLEMDSSAAALLGLSREMQEFSIAVAASVAVDALDEGYSVGLLANCAARISPEQRGTAPPFKVDERSWREHDLATELAPDGVQVPFARDPGQYERLLTTCSRLVPSQSIPMEGVLEKQERLFTGGTGVILVSAVQALTSATIEWLRDVRSRGIYVQCVMIGDTDRLLSAQAIDLPIYFIGGSEKWHALIHACTDEKR